MSFLNKIKGWGQKDDAAFAGDWERARQIHEHWLPLMKANFRESNPIPVKWALERLGLIGGAAWMVLKGRA